jgi:hypothetical protein
METKIEEIWKDVVGYEGYYQVSNLGHVKSIAVGHQRKGIRVMRPGSSGSGYYHIRLYNKVSVKDVLVHRIVATTWIDNPNNFKFVNHKDGNKLNNIVSNLEWCSRAENSRHAIRMGLQPAIPPDKLVTKEKLEVAFQMRREGHSQQSIGNALGVGQSVVSRMLSLKRRYAHVYSGMVF